MRAVQRDLIFWLHSGKRMPPVPAAIGMIGNLFPQACERTLALACVRAYAAPEPSDRGATLCRPGCPRSRERGRAALRPQAKVAAGRGARDARRSVEVQHLFWPAMELASTGIMSSGDASILSRVGRNRPQSGKPAQQGKGHVIANPARPGATWAPGRLPMRHRRPGPGVPPGLGQRLRAAVRCPCPGWGAFLYFCFYLGSSAEGTRRRASARAPPPGGPAAQRPRSTCPPSPGARAPPGTSATTPRPPLQLLRCPLSPSPCTLYHTQGSTSRIGKAACLWHGPPKKN